MRSTEQTAREFTRCQNYYVFAVTLGEIQF